jgi:hypothetical protein
MWISGLAKPAHDREALKNAFAHPDATPFITEKLTYDGPPSPLTGI